MRPTGRLHLGHLVGALTHWVKLQQQAECFYFVADWHALTTQYDNPLGIEQASMDMVVGEGFPDMSLSDGSTL